MEKVVRDGKVAVLFSPGYGAGWYTWNQDNPEIVFDPNIVHFVETQEFEKLEAYVDLKYPDLYLSGLGDLEIKWIPEGTEFRISEYDGNESVVTKQDDTWFVA